MQRNIIQSAEESKLGDLMLLAASLSKYFKVGTPRAVYGRKTESKKTDGKAGLCFELSALAFQLAYLEELERRNLGEMLYLWANWFETFPWKEKGIDYSFQFLRSPMNSC